jgi:serine/threonine protein kinase
MRQRFKRSKSKTRNKTEKQKNIHQCDGNDIQCTIIVGQSENTFYTKFKSKSKPDRLWTIEEKLGKGTYGATFLATSNIDKVFLSETETKTVAVKAQLFDDNSTINQQMYDRQEYENQHHMACKFNKELKNLQKKNSRLYAIFPEVYFIGDYNPSPDSFLTRFATAGIQQSVVAGMEKLEFTLSKTLEALWEDGDKDKAIAELVDRAIVSVANTLQEVNKGHGMKFVHGDLHDGNIMHDKSQENFYIIDFGAARINPNEKSQLDLPNLTNDGYWYDMVIKDDEDENPSSGSRGLDLMTLCLSLVEYVNVRRPSETNNGLHDEKKGLLSHLWYPLWGFFGQNPVGKIDEEVDDNIDQFLNPRRIHFLGAGENTYRPDWPRVRNKKTRKVKMLNLAHYYAYGAGDKDVISSLVFTPEKILSYNARNDPQFMTAVRMYCEAFHEDSEEQAEAEQEEYKEKEEEEKDAGICANTGCLVMYMPQFRTFTLND